MNAPPKGTEVGAEGLRFRADQTPVRIIGEQLIRHLPLGVFREKDQKTALTLCVSH
jgi:hypothetical protein